ncbi:hypothetical protein FRC03_000213 [Tulasnella sp. 419]|nr:hypothetical protein FRC03_000213 [Tulasnella sp. 419]
MSDLVIREVKPGVWTFSRPFLRAPFVPFGGRSTAIKLNDGSVWLVASTRADDETIAKINEIGPVKYIVSPDVEHHLSLKAYSDIYPEAKVIGVIGHELKVSPELKLSGQYGTDPEGTLYGYEDEISAVFFPAFANKDVAFFHKASKTLITADLIFNFPPKEAYSKSKEHATSWLPGHSKINPWTWVGRTFIGGLAKDVHANSGPAKVVASWDFDTIIMCHGDVIEGRGKEAWNSMWSKYLK